MCGEYTSSTCAVQNVVLSGLDGSLLHHSCDVFSTIHDQTTCIARTSSR